MEINYKTTTYQRKAYEAYLERNKNNEEFISKRKEAQRKYYQKNREKILKKIKEKKELKELKDSIIIVQDQNKENEEK